MSDKNNTKKWQEENNRLGNLGQNNTLEKKTAVALSYDARDEVPKIIASGKGHLAKKIIEGAEKEKIPIHKDDALTKTLSKLEVGESIPPELYDVIAEVLVFVDSVDRIKGKMKQGDKQPVK